MADRTKAELQKEADKLGVEVDDNATKAELEQAIEAYEAGNRPDTYEARFDPAERVRQSRAARRPADSGPQSNEGGPDASAGVGGGTGTTTTR